MTKVRVLGGDASLRGGIDQLHDHERCAAVNTTQVSVDSVESGDDVGVVE